MISRGIEIVFFVVWTAATVLISYWLGQQAYTWMPPEATQEAEAVDSLFSFLVTLGSVVFLGIFGMIAHSLIYCRAPQGDFSEGHPARGNGKLEVLWTVVPTVLVLWIGIQGFHIYGLLNIEGLEGIAAAPIGTEPAYAAEPSPTSMPVETIEVTAKQWAWSFRYPAQNVTSSELHLRANQRVRLALKSEDVLHGFYVPAFRVKQDIIPAKDISLVISPKLEGKYRLHDSQFSGTYFALMEAEVYVESPDAYQQWLSTAALNPPLNPDLAAAEHADPPSLWGQRWAVKAPDSFFKSALKANAPSMTPNL